MVFECTKCLATFAKQRDLTSHSMRKRPCDVVNAHKCPHCPKSFTRIDNLMQHKKSCRAYLAAECEDLRRRLATAESAPVGAAPAGAAPTATISTTSIIGSINTTVNNVVNNVQLEIAPWGSPLQLTDTDVEAVLSKIPGIAGAPELPEVVTTLMELVKRSHLPLGARNVHINPKRSDQALALIANGWAALPLSEATAALFDNASSRIATPALSRRVVNDPLQVLRATVPAQYNTERQWLCNSECDQWKLTWPTWRQADQVRS